MLGDGAGIAGPAGRCRRPSRTPCARSDDEPALRERLAERAARAVQRFTADAHGSRGPERCIVRAPHSIDGLMIYVCIPSYNEAPTVGPAALEGAAGLRRLSAGVPAPRPRRRMDRRHRRGPGALYPGAAAHRDPARRAAGLRGVGRGAAAPGRGADRPPQARCRHPAPRRLHPQPADVIPDLVRRIESGADIVVAEGTLEGEPSRADRLLRRFAPLLLRGAVSVPGVTDVVSRLCRSSGWSRCATPSGASPARLLVTDGWAANAELYWRARPACAADRDGAGVERHDLRQRPSRLRRSDAAHELWRSRGAAPRPRRSRRLAESAPRRETERQAEAAS